jgi:hypothetical protein
MTAPLGRTRGTRREHHSKINELVEEVYTLRKALGAIRWALRNGQKHRELSDDLDEILGDTT